MNIRSKYDKMRLMKKELNVGYIRLFYHYAFNKNNEFKIALRDGLNINIKYGLSSLAKLLSNGWKIISVEDGLLTLEGSNDTVITCRTRIGFDLGHLEEIYINKQYGYDFTGKNIIDIGMSNGDSSIYFAKNGAKRVIGLEPDKRSFNLAVKNIQSSKVDNVVIPLNKAIAVNEGIVELMVYRDNPNANSIDVKNMVKLNDEKHKEVVEGITLKKILDLFNGESKDLLKMDCEGCEYSILYENESVLKKFSRIIIEYHNGYNELKTKLENSGFSVKYTKPNVWVDKSTNIHYVQGYLYAIKKD